MLNCSSPSHYTQAVLLKAWGSEINLFSKGTVLGAVTFVQGMFQWSCYELCLSRDRKGDAKGNHTTKAISGSWGSAESWLSWVWSPLPQPSCAPALLAVWHPLLKWSSSQCKCLTCGLRACWPMCTLIEHDKLEGEGEIIWYLLRANSKGKTAAHESQILAKLPFSL